MLLSCCQFDSVKVIAYVASPQKIGNFVSLGSTKYQIEIDFKTRDNLLFAVDGVVEWTSEVHILYTFLHNIYFLGIYTFYTF